MTVLVHALPLYPQPSASCAHGGFQAALGLTHPLPRDPHCTRCPISSRHPRTVCMPADGQPGGLYVVGEKPGAVEDDVGRPNWGASGSYLRLLLQRFWKDGPVAFDNAVRCAPGREDLTPGMVDACRPYLAGALREVRPHRILALGGWAFYSVLGRKPPVFSARRAVGWILIDEQQGWVPVYLLIHPAAALRNRVVKGWFEDDLRWACESAVPRGFIPSRGTYSIVTDADSAQIAEEEIREQAHTSFDCEWVGRPFHSNFHLISVACTIGYNDSAWVWDVAALQKPECVEPLRRLMADHRVRKAGHSISGDMHAIELGIGVTVAGVVSDTKPLRKLLDTDGDGYLETMDELVGMGGHKDEVWAAKTDAVSKLRSELQRKAKPARSLSLFDDEPRYPHLPPQIAADVIEGIKTTKGEDSDAFAFGLVPSGLLSRYNARDAIATARLDLTLGGALARMPELHRTYEALVMPSTMALRQVERWGIAVDRGAIAALHEYLQSKIKQAEAALSHYAEINWRSTDQISDYFYNTLKLPIGKETDGGSPSTDEEAITSLKDLRPEPGLLLELRRLDKLDTTYAVGMLRHIGADDRIHTSLHPDGAASGRTSSSDPNLQNVTRNVDAEGNPEGGWVRNCFVAPPGHKLINFDYRQIEYRIWGMLSKDPKIRAAFDSGVDFHQRTAMQVAPIVWKMRPDQVEKRHRDAGKTVNYSIVYRIGLPSLARRLNITKQEAQKLVVAVLGEFRVGAAWLDEQVSFAQHTGTSRTWWDGKIARVRNLWKIADHDEKARGHAERAAVNSPIQGTASEYCTKSVTDVVDFILRANLPEKLVLPVHDSLLLEVPDDRVVAVACYVSEIMLGQPSDGFPIEIDMEIGPSWGNMHKTTIEALKKNAKAA